MKVLLFTIVFLIASLLHSTASAQEIKTDSVFWDNGDVSLLSELGPVWIILKKGSDLKGVRINEIKKQKGMLIYEKEKCLHDVSIANIKKIQAGKYSLSSMYFYPDNTPYIKKDYLRLDAMITYSDFKSFKISAIHEVKSNAGNQVHEPFSNTILNQPSDSKIICDTIIDEAGHITLAKIIEMDAKFLSYKKFTNPDGPVYLKSSEGATVIKHNNYSVITFKKIN